MKPWFHETAGEFAGQVKFVEVDVDKSKDVAEEYGVRAMPTIVLMRGSEEVDRIEGANQAKILSMIKAAM